MLTNTDDVEEGRWMNNLGKVVKYWVRNDSNGVHCRDYLLTILKECGLLFFFFKQKTAYEI